MPSSDSPSTLAAASFVTDDVTYSSPDLIFSRPSSSRNLRRSPWRWGFKNLALSRQCHLVTVTNRDPEVGGSVEFL